MAAEFHVKEEVLVSELESIRRYRLNPARIEITDGSAFAGGGHGTVKVARLRSTSGLQVVVVKELHPVEDSMRRRIAIRLVREIKIWITLDHPNVLPFLGFHLSEDFDDARLVFPYKPSQSVMHYTKANKPDYIRRLQLVWDSIEGLKYLHDRRHPICHGDLKAANILVNEREEAMLCDLGLAKVLNCGPSRLTTTDGFKGSYRWCSPEVLNGEERTLSSDMWAWACCVLEMMQGTLPYAHLKSEALIIKGIVTGEFPKNLDALEQPVDLRGLLEPCWEFEAEDRPTVTQSYLQVESLYSSVASTTLSSLNRPNRKMSRAESTATRHGPQLELEILYQANSRIVSAGSLLSLVHYMVGHSIESDTNTKFRNTFLSTYSGHSTSDEVLDALTCLSQGGCCQNLTIRHSVDVRYNILTVLSDWVEVDPIVRSSAELMTKMQGFVASMTSSDTLGTRASQLNQHVLRHKLAALRHPPSVSTPSVSTSRSISASDWLESFTPTTLSSVLKRITRRLFDCITIADCSSFVMNRAQPAPFPVLAFDSHLDKLSALMKHLILGEPERSVRTKRCVFLIQTAKECRKQGDFASAKAIVSALSSPVIARLSRTKEKVPTATADDLKKLEELMNKQGNYHPYRSALRDYNDGAIPDLYIHLRIFRHAYEDTPATIPGRTGPLINYVKYSKLYDSIVDVLRYQESPRDPPRSNSDKLLVLVDNELESISITDKLKKQFEMLSTKHQAVEDADYRSLRDQRIMIYG